LAPAEGATPASIPRSKDAITAERTNPVSSMKKQRWSIRSRSREEIPTHFPGDRVPYAQQTVTATRDEVLAVWTERDAVHPAACASRDVSRGDVSHTAASCLHYGDQSGVTKERQPLTRAEWPDETPVSLPLATSHKRSFPALSPDATVWPSRLKASSSQPASPRLKLAEAVR
jgi:hypothetical protein